MPSSAELPEAPWLAAVETQLKAAAGRRETVTYLALAQAAVVPEPHRIHKLTLALEDLVRRDIAAGRPLLAALAVSRAEGGIPGRGFFQLLAELGRYDGPYRGPEAIEAHRLALEAAWRYWSRDSQQ